MSRVVRVGVQCPTLAGAVAKARGGALKKPVRKTVSGGLPSLLRLSVIRNGAFEGHRLMLGRGRVEGPGDMPTQARRE